MAVTQASSPGAQQRDQSGQATSPLHAHGQKTDEAATGKTGPRKTNRAQLQQQTAQPESQHGQRVGDRLGNAQAGDQRSQADEGQNEILEEDRRLPPFRVRCRGSAARRAVSVQTRWTWVASLHSCLKWQKVVPW